MGERELGIWSAVSFQQADDADCIGRKVVYVAAAEMGPAMMASKSETMSVLSSHVPIDIERSDA